MIENGKPTFRESWAQGRRIKLAIFKSFVICDSIRLKCDRRCEFNLHVEAAREMFVGLCDEAGLDSDDVIEEIAATRAIYEYKLQQFSRYVELYELGDRTPKVIAFNRRLYSVRRLIDHLETGY